VAGTLEGMRMLFTTWAWPSHLYVLVPLAWACRAAGHEVLVASQPEILGEISGTGLPGAAVGADVDAVGLVRGYVLPSEAGQGDGLGQAPKLGKGPRAMQMFMAHAESMVDGLVDLAREWQPDVVVFEPTALAGPVAAAAVGVPGVRHLYGTDLMMRARAVLPDALAGLARRHGTGEFDPFGVSTIDPTPTSFQVPTDYRRLPMRYVPFNGPGPRPEPLPRTDKPRVCLTWGHTIAKLDPKRFLVPEIVEAIHPLDIEVVVAVSAEQRALLGEVPDNVTVVVDNPVHHLLSQCDLVIGHGGAGTVLTALHHGLPLLLVPQLPDHLGHSGRVLASGAGEVLARDEVTRDRLRDEVTRLLADGPEREAATKLSQEMRQQPPPSELVAELESIARVGV
jgi:UDP:flavonoid glycosyltransferase YjiC (YdhE family)